MQSFFNKAAKQVNHFATNSVTLIKKVNSHIPWVKIAVAISTLVLLYLSHIPAMAGILVGYVFSKAYEEPDRELDKLMKSIKEFVVKHYFIAFFLGAINPIYTIPCIHLFCSINIGRYLRGLDARDEPHWRNIIPQRIRAFL